MTNDVYTTLKIVSLRMAPISDVKLYALYFLNDEQLYVTYYIQSRLEK